jgi:hypothetical protein
MDKLEREDKRFRFIESWFLQEQALENYKYFEYEIRDEGFQIINSNNHKAKVYTPQLCLIFSSRDLPVREHYTKIETKINGYDYLQTYIGGYKEGEQYFDDEFRISPNTLYGENAEDYVKDIHYNFFHAPFGALISGWGFVKKHISITISHKEVKGLGYYSGIVSKVEEQVNKYPRLFKKFDKCEHDLQTQQKEKTAPPPKALKTLKELLKGKFGTDKEYQSFKKQLFSKDLLSQDRSTWIGTDQNGKIQLASVIKYAGREFLQRSLSEKEVKFISTNDFNNTVSPGSVKKGKADFGQFYFD